MSPADSSQNNNQRHPKKAKNHDLLRSKGRKVGKEERERVGDLGNPAPHHSHHSHHPHPPHPLHHQKTQRGPTNPLNRGSQTTDPTPKPGIASGTGSKTHHGETASPTNKQQAANPSGQSPTSSKNPGSANPQGRPGASPGKGEARPGKAGSSPPQPKAGPTPSGTASPKAGSTHPASSQPGQQAKAGPKSNPGMPGQPQPPRPPGSPTANPPTKREGQGGSKSPHVPLGMKRGEGARLRNNSSDFLSRAIPNNKQRSSKKQTKWGNAKLTGFAGHLVNGPSELQAKVRKKVSLLIVVLSAIALICLISFTELLAAVGGGAASNNSSSSTTAAVCSTSPSGATLSGVGVSSNPTAIQRENAQTIISIVKEEKLPQRAAIIAIADGFVESSLTVLANPVDPASLGSPNAQAVQIPSGDSLGIYQQEPNQGWSTLDRGNTYAADGTGADLNSAAILQMMNPAYEIEAWLGTTPNTPIPGAINPGALTKGLQNINGGNWQSLSPGEAAWDIQRAGNRASYEDAVDSFVGKATALVNSLWNGTSPAPLPVPFTVNFTEIFPTASNQSPTGTPSSLSNACGQGAPLPSQALAAIAQEALNEVSLNIPYVWGGGNPSGPSLGLNGDGASGPPGQVGQPGFDCSGLVAYVVGKVTGLNLFASARTSEDQYNKIASTGLLIPNPNPSNLVPGDLVFYAGSDGTTQAPGHVAIYVGNGNIVQEYDVNYDAMESPLTQPGQVVGAGPYPGTPNASTVPQG